MIMVRGRLRTLFSILLAFRPNLRVWSEWSNCDLAGEMHRMMDVFVFPPSDDLSIFVKDVFLYGTC